MTKVVCAAVGCIHCSDEHICTLKKIRISENCVQRYMMVFNASIDAKNMNLRTGKALRRTHRNERETKTKS